jgi:hypothetical protein
MRRYGITEREQLHTELRTEFVRATGVLHRIRRRALYEVRRGANRPWGFLLQRIDELLEHREQLDTPEKAQQFEDALRAIPRILESYIEAELERPRRLGIIGWAA